MALALAGCGGGSNPPPGTPARRAPPAGDPLPHVRAIAAIAQRNDGTRAAGTPGDRATAVYIAGRLRAAGYDVRMQRFRIVVSRLRAQPVVELGGRREAAIALQFSGSGDVRGPVRAIDGLGCAAGEYAGVRPGEVVAVRRGGCFFRVKAQLAQRAGAGALLVTAARPLSATLVGPGIRIPVLTVGRGAPLRGTAHVVVRAVVRRARTANVIGRLPGGPEERVVMAGAHLDSVPAGPGVNDDGSGVAAVLAVAERLARRPPAGAAVRVGFWAAEEIGLVGSRRYVSRLGRGARRAIRAYLNLDMVGSPHPARLVYGDRAVVRVLRAQLPGARTIDLGGGSDHAPFAAAGIPVGGYFTGNESAQDPCYHRACDDLRNVDERILATMTGAAEATLRELASG